MQPIPLDITYRDLHQWLHGTWFSYKGKPAKYIEAAPPEKGKEIARLYAHTATTGGIETPLKDCELHWPKCGSVNVGNKYAVHVIRSPAKVYCRSYNPRQVIVEVPKRWEVLTFMANPDPRFDQELVDANGFKLVEALFSPEYPSFVDAQNDLLAGRRLTVALTPSLIIGKERQGFSVFYRGKHIGEYENGKLVNCDIDSTIEARLHKLLGIG